MSSNVLPISNVVTISVSSPPAGLSNYQINNLLISSKEIPIADVPAAGFFTYLTAQQVGTDWGTGSETYQQALAVFGQSPNILAGGGSLFIFPQGSGSTLAQAIAIMQPLVFFGAVLACGYAPNQAEYVAAAVVCLASETLLGIPSATTADLTGMGLFATIFATVNPYARMFLYTVGAQAARVALAAYFGRAMSTNFAGSNTTSNMHLKQLAGVLPDPGITQSVLTAAQAVGVDVYCNIAGIPVVFTAGANQFWDQIYNQVWLVFALEVAIFNALAQSFTKVPQTEQGVASLRQAAISVLNQAVTNGYLAPGQWNSSLTFGPGTSLVQNVLEQGFYVYTQPVNQQSQADRVQRKAPLMQIAGKQAGAINSATVIVYVEP